MQIFEAHRDYREHGILPEPGGMKDQSEVMTRCFRLLEKVHRDCDEEKQREEKKKKEAQERMAKLKSGR